MRLFGFRVPFFVAVLLLGIGSTVWALGHHRTAVETVYVGPTTTTMAIPTSYVVTTSWVEPTSYVVPTSYATAYVAEPVAVVQPTYYSTAYVRTGLFGRRRLVEGPLVATYPSTYLPTAYYVPSAYYPPRTYAPTVLVDPLVRPSSYVASADCPCPERVASAASTPSRPTGAMSAPRIGDGSKTLRSEADEPAMPSDVDPVPPERPAASPNAAGDAASGNAQGGTPSAATPPAAPALKRSLQEQPKSIPEPPAAGSPAPTSARTPKATLLDPTTVRQSQPAPSGTVAPQTQSNPNAGSPATPAAPPVAPGDEFPPLENTPAGEVQRRQAMRPRLPSPTLRASSRRVLTGFVQSRSDGQFEEGVRISVANASDQTLDKSTLTDAFGRFSMRLAEGDWTVYVTMPSGRVYPVSEIRVDGGQITDSLGRRVPSLEITR